MDPHETYETVRIVKHKRPCGYAIIPKNDYDPSKHTLYVDKVEAVDKPKPAQRKAK